MCNSYTYQTEKLDGNDIDAMHENEWRKLNLKHKMNFSPLKS